MAGEKPQHDHGGHRKRMWERLDKEGFDTFNEIETLETLLYFTNVRQDTNPIAHRLLKEFGTLAAVMDAPQQALLKVDGIGETSAKLLKLMPQIARKYEISRQSNREILDTTEKVGLYLRPYFFSEQDEVVYLLCLDGKCYPKACKRLFSGNVNSAAISSRKIVETALNYKAASVVLAHNHPSGIPLPSSEDETTTRLVQRALEAVDILLADHIIIAGSEFVSMADNGFFERK